MGNRNVCGPKQKEEGKYTFKKRIMCSKQLNNTMIEILQEDHNAESQDIIVNASHNPSDYALIRKLGNQSQKDKLQQMKGNDMLLTELIDGQLVINLKVPTYSENQDVIRIYNGYLECLQCINKNKQESITFPDTHGLQFSLPKQVNAQVLFRAIVNFISETEIVTINRIVFKSMNYQIVNNIFMQLQIYIYELEKIFVEFNSPEQLKENNRKFIEHFNQKITEEQPDAICTHISSMQPSVPAQSDKLATLQPINYKMPQSQ